MPEIEGGQSMIEQDQDDEVSQLLKLNRKPHNMAKTKLEENVGAIP